MSASLSVVDDNANSFSTRKKDKRTKTNLMMGTNIIKV